jgi:hypothetical protein
MKVPSETIRLPVKRNSKVSAGVGAIRADRTVLKPLVILPRETCETELYQMCYTEEKVIFHPDRSIETLKFSL